jgi:hypothetical protein
MKRMLHLEYANGAHRLTIHCYVSEDNSLADRFSAGDLKIGNAGRLFGIFSKRVRTRNDIKQKGCLASFTGRPSLPNM